MGELKDYISRTAGCRDGAYFPEDVIASIAAAAVTDVDGVCGLSANMAELLNKKSQTKGVRLTVGENDSITIDCNVIALYGHPVMELAKEIQNAVSDAIAAMTGLQVTGSQCQCLRHCHGQNGPINPAAPRRERRRRSTL